MEAGSPVEMVGSARGARERRAESASGYERGSQRSGGCEESGYSSAHSGPLNVKDDSATSGRCCYVLIPLQALCVAGTGDTVTWFRGLRADVSAVRMEVSWGGVGARLRDVRPWCRAVGLAAARGDPLLTMREWPCVASNVAARMPIPSCTTLAT